MENNEQLEQFNKIFISENLKALRQAHNLSTTQVAKILGKSRQGYVNYETGAREIRIHDLLKLSSFYNTSIDIIVGNPFSLKNENTIAFKHFKEKDEQLEESMPFAVSTHLDDVIVVTISEQIKQFFWKTTINQEGHIMLFDYYNKPYISKVYYNAHGGGHFYINDKPFYFNKSQAKNIYFRGLFMSELKKNFTIPHFF